MDSVYTMLMAEQKKLKEKNFISDNGQESKGE